MRILLIAPNLYALNKTLKHGFEQAGHQVFLLDYRQRVKHYYETINNKKNKLLRGWRAKWDKYYFETINKEHLTYYREVKPDLVFIYNNEMLLPATIIEFKKASKVFFFLGDSPFYTPTSIYNLEILFQANQIFSPDTGWLEQLQLLGLKNLHHLLYYTESAGNKRVEISGEEKNKYDSDMVFIGNNYPGAWGYKRALYLNQFTDLDFTLYGPPSWRIWFDRFPKLEKCFVPHSNGRLGFEKLNIIMNCAKLYPVDANPGILNGIHMRAFECIASGVLPLIEYRFDLYSVFNGVDIPVINNYGEAAGLAKKLLADEHLRSNTLELMRTHLKENYSLQRAVNKILAYV